MGDQKKNNNPAGLEDSVELVRRKTRKYLLNQEILAKLEQKRKIQRRHARRYNIDAELIETNGNPGNGSKIIDLSMNGAKVEVPFSPPFMSQIALKFSLPESEKIFHVVGRVIWSRMTLQRGWYEVGVQFYQSHWEIDQLLRLQVR